MGAIDTPRGAIGVSRASPESGGRTPILFLHGVGSDRSVWAPQLEHFGLERLAIAIDYPGYGDSAPRPGVGRDGFARAAFDALDALGVERAHICGLSLGGVIAIAMHALDADRCASLILADSFAVHPEGAAIYQRSTAASENPGMAAMAATRVQFLVAKEASTALRAEVERVMAQIDPAAFRQGAEAVWLADQRDRAAAIAVPTLVLVGAEDGITPPPLSDALAALVPGALVERIAGAGHLANLEQPERFNAMIDRFLLEIDNNSNG